VGIGGLTHLRHWWGAAALVTRIDQHYGESVQVVLTGAITPKSRYYLSQVNALVGRELEFKGPLISAEDVRFAKIDNGVLRMTSKKKGWPGRRRGDNTLCRG